MSEFVYVKLPLTEEEVTKYYGRRCDDFEPECAVCWAWAQWDRSKGKEVDVILDIAELKQYMDKELL